MYPVLLHIAGINVSTFMAATLLAFVAPLLLFISDHRRDPAVRLPWTFWLCLFASAEIGCRLYFQAQYRPPSELLGVRWLWNSGRVSYGGLIGAIAAGVLYCYARRISVRQTADLLSPYLPLVEAFVRLGCFATGCCYGTATRLPWGVQYPLTSCPDLRAQQMREGLLDGTAFTAPTHPVQLYTVFAMCALFVGLTYARKLKLPVGGHFLLYLAGYGAVRFVLEFWRGDCPRYFAPGFTSSQMLSAALAIAASAGLVWAYRRMRHGSVTMA